MEFKGTKGQWKTGIFSNTSVYVPGGATICQMLPTDLSMLETNEQEDLIQEIKANSLIISKAPEMLEMLIKIFDSYQSGDYPTEYEYDEIKNIIKEATEL